MNDDNLLGGVLGQLGQTAKKVGQQIIKLPEEMAADLGGQVGGSKKDEQAASAKGSGPLRSEASEPKQWQSDEERTKFLRDLYGSSQQNPNEKNSVKSASSAKASAAKPEEQKKLLELRQDLHKQVYYDPTFNPVKKQEERPVEKIEKEKKMEALELEEKEKNKPPPLAVVREQNKAEQFRGASG